MKAGCRFRFPPCLLLCFFVLPLFTGCRNCELVETALRAREYDVQVLKEELLRLEFRNQALERELAAVRQQGVWKVPSELAGQNFGVRRITLGRGTGGYDADNTPGDESLYLVLQPRDGQDDVIKAPGTVTISALEISPEGIKRPISAWKIPPHQLRNQWSQGLFSTGYRLKLPWQQTLRHDKIRVIVQLKLSDGRFFETDKDIRIRLDPAMPRIREEREVIPQPNGPELPSPEELWAPQPLQQSQGWNQNQTKTHSWGTPNWSSGPQTEYSSPPIRRRSTSIQQTSYWHAPPLHKAVRIQAPVSLENNSLEIPSFPEMPKRTLRFPD